MWRLTLNITTWIGYTLLTVGCRQLTLNCLNKKCPALLDQYTLRLLEERDTMQAVRLEALRQDINKGLDSLEREGSKPMDIDAIKAKGRARLVGNSN